MATFVPITWGLIRLWCSSIEVDGGRSLIVHDLSQGDEHPTHDAGKGPRPVRCSLMFDDFPGETRSDRERLQELIAAVDAGTEAVFSHPILGSFVAQVGPFSHRIDEHGIISAEITFYPAEGSIPVSPAGAGAPGVAGEAAVNAAADDLDLSLETVYDQSILDLEDSPIVTTTKAREAVTNWNAGESVPTRTVTADVADISSRISDHIDALELEDDIALFDVYKSMIMFGDSVRSAGIAATSETPAVFVMRVTTPVVLLRLCAQTYGGREAEDRERQVRELNDIRSPGWFGPGDLLMPVVGSNSKVI